MYIHVVNQKVNQTIDTYANADAKQPPYFKMGAECIAECTWERKDKEKQIITFEEAFFFEMRLVVILMPAPQEAMHHILMRKPCYEFHRCSGS